MSLGLMVGPVLVSPYSCRCGHLFVQGNALELVEGLFNLEKKFVKFSVAIINQKLEN